jgi:hypothetical protein
VSADADTCSAAGRVSGPLAPHPDYFNADTMSGPQGAFAALDGMFGGALPHERCAGDPRCAMAAEPAH